MSDPSMPQKSPVAARQGLVARIQAILLKPAETWDLIAAEADSIPAIFTGYVVPLAVVAPVCGVLAAVVFGHLGLLWAIVAGIVSYVLSLGMTYVMAFIVNALAPSFDGRKDVLSAFKLVAYAGTASYVAGICQLLPILGGLLALAAFIYSLYLFYLGLPKLMKTPADKSVVYIAVVAICGIVMSALIWAVVGGITAVGVGAAMLSGNHLSLNGPATSVTIHDKTGSATVNIGQAVIAANQIAAQASATQATAAHPAGAPATPLKIADAKAMLSLMPPIFDGATRADTTVSSGGVAGMAASTAEATYTVGGGTVHLKIADMGSMAGVGAMANALNVNSNTSSDGGYETIKTDGNRITTERYDTAGKSGEYDLVLNGRVAVSAEGSHVDMATLKSLVGEIDIDKVDALTR